MSPLDILTTPVIQEDTALEVDLHDIQQNNNSDNDNNSKKKRISLSPNLVLDQNISTESTNETDL